MFRRDGVGFFFSYKLYVFRQIRHWISGCFDDQLGDKTMQSVRQLNKDAEISPSLSYRRRVTMVRDKYLNASGCRAITRNEQYAIAAGFFNAKHTNFTDLKAIRTADTDPGGERPTAAVRAKAKQGPNGIPR